MLLSTGQPNTRPAADDGIGSVLKTVSILRIGAGATLMAFHGWPGAVGAYSFLWKEKAWSWVPVFEQAGLPFAHLIAPLVAVVLALVALSWIIGFLTRLFSFFAIPLALGAMMLAKQVDPTHLESSFLYLAIAITLLLFGSGNVSIDWFFQLGSRKKETLSSW